MTKRLQELVPLREVLAELYPRESDGRRVAAEAGLNTALIAFDSKATTNWFNILEYASNAHLLTALVAVARREYPNHERLQTLSDVLPPTSDEDFMRLAVAEARKCRSADKPESPKVAAIVVNDGHLLGVAHRGEGGFGPGDHAEYILLEKKLPTMVLEGATIFTTLEPCTSRGQTKDGKDKVPCAERIRDRKLRRVVYAMIDPNDSIRGKGELLLANAGLIIERFPDPLRRELEELNQDFIRDQRKKSSQKS